MHDHTLYQKEWNEYLKYGRDGRITREPVHVDYMGLRKSLFCWLMVWNICVYMCVHLYFAGFIKIYSYHVSLFSFAITYSSAHYQLCM